MAHIFTCTPAAKTALKPDYAGLLVSRTGLVAGFKGNLDTATNQFGDLNQLNTSLARLGDQLGPANQFSLVWDVFLFQEYRVLNNFLLDFLYLAVLYISVCVLYCIVHYLQVMHICIPFVHVHTVSSMSLCLYR